MRLSELINESGALNTGPRTNQKHGYKSSNPADIKEIVDRVIESDEFKDLVELAPLVSTPVQIRHGYLSFEVTKDKLYYEINFQGNVRYKSKADSPHSYRDYSTGLLKVGDYNRDTEPFNRYIYNINEVIKKIKSRQNLAQKPLSIFLNGNKGDRIITSFEQLEGIETINNSIRLFYMKLSDLIGCPKRLRTLYIYKNEKPLSLEGCPEKLELLKFHNTEILNIELLPKIIKKEVSLAKNEITSLSGIGRKFILECPKIDIRNNFITSNILGLLLVKNLKQTHYWSGLFQSDKAFKIVSKHLEGERDILECQEELITEGLKEYAKL